MESGKSTLSRAGALALLSMITGQYCQAQESSLFHNPIAMQRQVSSAPAAQQPQLIAQNQPQFNPNATVANPLRPDAAGQVGGGSTQPLPMQQQTQPAMNNQGTLLQPSMTVTNQGTVAPANFQANYPAYSPMTIQNPAVYNYQPPVRQRVLKVHDIVQIRVEELSRMTADGVASSRKTGLYDARLQDWVRLEGLTSLKPAVQADGDPRVRGETNQTLRANSQLITRESLTSNIAAEIADILPNGNIVLEAHKEITINDNRWQMSLSGVCQDSAIGNDNVVLSKDIINLKIDKKEAGQVRDGYKRGWFTEWLGRFQPF